MNTQSASPLLALFLTARRLVKSGNNSFIACQGEEWFQFTLIPRKRMTIIRHDLKDPSRPVVAYLCDADGTLEKRVIAGSPSKRTQKKEVAAAHEAAELLVTLGNQLSVLTRADHHPAHRSR